MHLCFIGRITNPPVLKEDTIIFEDSGVGIEAAEKSGATVFVVRGFA